MSEWFVVHRSDVGRPVSEVRVVATLDKAPTPAEHLAWCKANAAFPADVVDGAGSRLLVDTRFPLRKYP
jgi:hypothetical protein